MNYDSIHRNYKSETETRFEIEQIVLKLQLSQSNAATNFGQKEYIVKRAGSFNEHARVLPRPLHGSLGCWMKGIYDIRMRSVVSAMIKR